MAKYEVADKNKVTTSFTLSRFKMIAFALCDGVKVDRSISEEFNRLFLALLNDETIIFASEEELPF